MMPLPARLDAGLWGVLATPFRGSDLVIDEESLVRLVQDQMDSGAAGLVVLGVFGEGARLTTDEQLQVVKSVEREAGALPLVLGLAEHNTADVVTKARRLVEAVRGTPSLMVQAPTANADQLTEHLTAVHEATGAGIVLQDYPFASGVSISSQVILTVVAECSFVVAVKSEAPPTSLAIAQLTAGTSTPVFGGLGGLGLLDELMAGAAGAMTGFSHPAALRATLSAWEMGGYESARETYMPWMPLVNFEAQAAIGLAIRKTVMFERGLITEPSVRPPALSMPEALRPMLRKHMASLPARVNS